MMVEFVLGMITMLIVLALVEWRLSRKFDPPQGLGVLDTQSPEVVDMPSRKGRTMWDLPDPAKRD